MRIFLSLSMCFLMFNFSAIAQTTDELAAQKELKEAELGALKDQVAALEGEISAIAGQMVTFPYWDKGTRGIIGLDLNAFNNWATRGDNLNSTATNIGVAFNGFANKIGEDYFWRNNGQLTLGWQKFSKADNDNSTFQKTADVFNVQSLYGRNITKTLAVSTLGELRTTFLDNAFNPAYIDLGVGLTWNPSPNFVAVFHPLNYNIIIADNAANFQSSLGCKVVADYSRDLGKGFSYRTNFSGFASYSDLSGLSNYTWINGLNFKMLGGIGVGLEYAIRKSRQETLPLGDEHFQSYFIMGVSYAL